ncbi:MotE family protein [Sphingorhabdus sp. M41]|uniref:MotE family protein n=1 Tax=Sphingorhabdus sp. M41 TaxID=1806885 RepID=UPI0009EF3D05|nr:hypothetical protein [Sphingorhabdus sp. M41]
MIRPTLLLFLASATGLSGIATALAATEEKQSPPTRLGTAIGTEIAAKDRAARERERALDLREQAAKATESRIAAQLTQGAQKAAPAKAGRKNGKSASPGGLAEMPEFDQLARIYQSMKPKQAALVFEQLDIDVQIAVAKRMRERSTAQIMAAMRPGNAARLSMALAGQKVASGPRPKSGAAMPNQAGRADTSTK